jgi:metal-responsive CopG/Arc/MetJ family transcriptional regulator
MKTIQMTLGKQLLTKVDRAVKKLHTTRSALIRESLEQYLESIQTKQLEARQKSGYQRHPVKAGEFDVWESEQEWAE